MLHRIRYHTEDLGRSCDLLDSIKMPQGLAPRPVPKPCLQCRMARHTYRRIPRPAPGHASEIRSRPSPAEPTSRVRRVSMRSIRGRVSEGFFAVVTSLYIVRVDLCHPPHDGIERRGGFPVVIGDNEARATQVVKRNAADSQRSRSQGQRRARRIVSPRSTHGTVPRWSLRNAHDFPCRRQVASTEYPGTPA